MKCGKNFSVEETAITVNGAIKKYIYYYCQSKYVITYFLTKINVQKVSTVTPLCSVKKKQSLRASSPFKKNASIEKGQTFIADSRLTFIFWELVWTQPKKKRAYPFPSLCHKQNVTLEKSFCETVPKSLFWVPTCVPGFEYEPWLAC